VGAVFSSKEVNVTSMEQPAAQQQQQQQQMQFVSRCDCAVEAIVPCNTELEI
jgi:hypothetical protein